MFPVIKNREFAPDYLVNKLVEDFCVDMEVDIPYSEKVNQKLFTIRFRAMSPYIDDKGLGYIDIFRSHSYQ